MRIFNQVHSIQSQTVATGLLLWLREREINFNLIVVGGVVVGNYGNDSVDK